MWRALLLIAIVSGILVACGGSKSQSPTTAPQTSPTEATPTPEQPTLAAQSTPAPAAVSPATTDAPQPTTPTSEPACPLKPLPKGCPATEPNVNRPCDAKGVECVYAAGCCPSPVYVCNKKGRFEARFQRC
jgi:hypothetical protein